jgi:hypothetical protein
MSVRAAVQRNLDAGSLRRRLGLALWIAVGLIILWPGAGVATAGTFPGPRVAHGTSPEGVPWEITAEHSRRTTTFHFSLEPPAYSGVGYSTQFRLPIPNSFVFTAVSGSDISPYPEGDLSGITDRAARTLDVRMSDGSHLSFKPQLAPPRLRERHPWLRTLRFFDVFYPSAIEPKVVRAFDAEGVLLAKRISHRGAF